jgi:hypothetical protein
VVAGMTKLNKYKVTGIKRQLCKTYVKRES